MSEKTMEPQERETPYTASGKIKTTPITMRDLLDDNEHLERELSQARERIDDLCSALKSQADWCDRYEQFASIHDDGEESLYAAQCAREMREALQTVSIAEKD